MKPCQTCEFVGTLMAHPQGPELFRAWWRMRQMEPAFDQYLAGDTLAQSVRRIIEDAVTRNGGNVRAAARELRISYSTVYRVIEGRTHILRAALQRGN